MAMELFQLAAKVLLDKEDFDKGVGEADKSGKELADKLSKYMDKAKKVVGGLFAVATVKKAASYVWDLANETAAAGDRIDKMSQSMGISRKAFQEWDYIMSQSGATMEDMSTAMRFMGQNITANSAETAASLSQLGLSAAHLQSLQPEEQFEKIVRAFQQMPPSADKSRLAMQIFGKNAQSLMPLLNSSTDSIDEFRAQAERLGLVMSDEDVDAAVAFGDALDDLQRTWTSFKYKIGAKILPGLTSGMQTITSSIGNISLALTDAFQTGDWGSFFNTLTQEIANFTPKAVETVVGMISGLFQNADKIVELGASIVTGLVDGIVNSLPILLDKLPAIMQTVGDTLNDIVPKLGQAMIDILNATFGLDIPEFDVIINWVQRAWDLCVEAFTIIGDWTAEAIEATVNWINNAWNDIVTAFDEMWNWTAEAIEATVQWFNNAWDAVVTAFNEIWNWTVGAIEATVQWFNNAWDTVTNAFTIAVGWIGKTVNVIVSWANAAWESTKSAFDQAVGWINRAFWVTVTWISDTWGAVKDAFDKAGQWINKAFWVTVTWISDTWGAIKGAFEQAGTWINKSFWVAVTWLNDTWESVKTAFNTAVDWVEKSINVAINWINDTWGNVSSAFATAKEWLTQKVIDITANFKSTVDDWITRIKNWMGGTDLKDIVANITGNPGEWIKRIYGWITTKIKDVEINFVSTISDFIQRIWDWISGTNNNAVINFGSTVSEWISRIWGWIQNGINIGVNFFGSVAEGVGSFFGGGNGNRSNELTGFGGGGPPLIGPNDVFYMNAKGDSYVPYDNYPALLHRGEAVLTADQARNWRNGRPDGINADMLYNAVAEAVAAAVGSIQVNMDGAAVGNMVTNQVSRNMYRKQAGRRYGVG